LATDLTSGDTQINAASAGHGGDFLSITPSVFVEARRNKRVHLGDRLKSLGPSVIATAAALVAIFIVIRLPGPMYADPGIWFFLLVLGVSFPLVLWLTLAIHEAGHLWGAALAGLEFRLVTVGPWRLARELRGTRLRFMPRSVLQWQGNAFCIPRHGRFLRVRLILFILGGPAATLAQTAVTLFIRAQLAHVALPFWLAQASFLLAYCPLAILPFTLFPMRFRGATTDAAQLIALLRKKEHFPRRAAINLLVAASIRGQRPRELDPQLLEVLCQLPPEAEEAQVGHYLAHLKALDSLDIPLAGYHLDMALRPFHIQSAAVPPAAYVLAAASFAARFGRGTAVAQEWLSLVRPDSYNALAIENEQLLWQTRAVVAFEAGELLEARSAAERSLALLPRIIEKGQAVVAEEILGDILAATTAVSAATTAVSAATTAVSAATTAVPVAAETASPPPHTGRRLALAGILVAGMLALGGLANGRFSLRAEQGQAHYRAGIAQLEDGRYQEAILSFDEAIRRNAGLDEAYWGRGQAHFALNQHTDAISDFDRALQLQGEQPNPWIYFYRGLSHTYLGHYPEATADYRRLADTATDERLLLAADHYQHILSRLTGERPSHP